MWNRFYPNSRKERGSPYSSSIITDSTPCMYSTGTVPLTHHLKLRDVRGINSRIKQGNSVPHKSWFRPDSKEESAPSDCPKLRALRVWENESVQCTVQECNLNWGHHCGSKWDSSNDSTSLFPITYIAAYIQGTVQGCAVDSVTHKWSQEIVKHLPFS
jgi:hypothetical protein